MTNTQISHFINRITDGDNVTTEDAIKHVAEMTERTVSDIEDVYYHGKE